MNIGGGGTHPSATSGARAKTGGDQVTTPSIADGPHLVEAALPPSSPRATNGFASPFTTPSALFLRPYKPRRILVPRFPPVELPAANAEAAKPDPTEISMLRHENSVLRGPLLQAFVDSATFYAEGISLREYFKLAMKKIEGQNGNRLLRKVNLPKQNTAQVKMTDEAAAVLCSWVCLFTRYHVANLSWNGAFDLDSFILLHGQVHAIKPPKSRLATHSERLRDLTELARLIESMYILDGQHPPYLMHLINKLKGLPAGPLLESYRLALETHFCFLTLMGGSNLLHQLKIKFDGLRGKEKVDFVKVLNLCNPPDDWLIKLENTVIFKEIIEWGLEVEAGGAGKSKISYKETSTSAFILIRNYTTHVSKHSKTDDGRQLYNVDGALLMIPEKLGDFVADMWFNLLHNNFHQNLGVEEIARNCMPSPTQVLCKRVENSNSSFMEVLAGDGSISQGKNGALQETKANVTLCNKDLHKSKNTKLEREMTYEDLLKRNKELERSAQISVILSKHVQDLCAKVGYEVPKEVIEIEQLKNEISVRLSEVSISSQTRKDVRMGPKDM